MILVAASTPPGVSQTGKAPDAAITVRYTDVRKAAGITFVQDSTQTNEKYYLETMGTTRTD
jgi:hypothetical protein